MPIGGVRQEDWQVAALHIGPGRIEQPGLGTGHEGTESDLEEGKPEEPLRPGHQGGQHVPLGLIGDEGGPEQVTKYDERHTQVQGKVISIDPRTLNEATGYHDPSEESLQPCQGYHDEQARYESPRQHAPVAKPRKGDDEYKEHKPCPKAVEVFPKVNELERFKTHTLIDLLILGGGLVEIKLVLPICRAQGRQGTRHDLPLGDAKPAASEARDPAYYDLEKDHDQTSDEPVPYHRSDFVVCRVLHVYAIGWPLRKSCCAGGRRPDFKK